MGGIRRPATRDGSNQRRAFRGGVSGDQWVTGSPASRVATPDRCRGPSGLRWSLAPGGHGGVERRHLAGFTGRVAGANSGGAAGGGGARGAGDRTRPGLRSTASRSPSAQPGRPHDLCEPGVATGQRALSNTHREAAWPQPRASGCGSSGLRTSIAPCILGIRSWGKQIRLKEAIPGNTFSGLPAKLCGLNSSGVCHQIR